jgi:hypothetical protein
MKLDLIKFRFVIWVALWATPFFLTAQVIDRNYLLGKFEPATHTQFVKLSDQHAKGSAE